MTDELDDFLNGDDESELVDAESEEQTASSSREAQKVELDLEDAPFLDDDDDDDEGEDTENLPAETSESSQKDHAKPLYRQPKIIIAAAVAVLIVVALCIYFGTKPAKKSVAQPKETASPTESQKSPAELNKNGDEFIVSFEPFWVEQKAKDSKTRFLVCRFSTVTQSEKLSYEVQQKKVILRDAIFYYLHNKDLKYLADKKNVKELKKDVLSVINQYLGNGQIETLLIEEYLVK